LQVPVAVGALPPFVPEPPNFTPKTTIQETKKVKKSTLNQSDSRNWWIKMCPEEVYDSDDGVVKTAYPCLDASVNFRDLIFLHHLVGFNPYTKPFGK
jgi:hypothetical protein